MGPFTTPPSLSLSLSPPLPRSPVGVNGWGPGLLLAASAKKTRQYNITLATKRTKGIHTRCREDAEKATREKDANQHTNAAEKHPAQKEVSLSPRVKKKKKDIYIYLGNYEHMKRKRNNTHTPPPV